LAAQVFENILELAGELGKHWGVNSGAAGGIGRGFLRLAHKPWKFANPKALAPEASSNS
jgi:hypothetical protein